MSRVNKSKTKFLMPLHSFTKFKIRKYYQNEPKVNSVCSRNILSKIKDVYMLGYTHLLSSNEYKKNGKILLK